MQPKIPKHATLPRAVGSKSSFELTLTTAAPAEKIWGVWIDVNAWPSWDSELTRAELNGPFRQGATGKLTPRSGPTTQFQIVEVIEGLSYTFVTKLPLAALRIRRTLKHSDGQTSFTHEVAFTGALGPLFALIFGKRFQQALPIVMDRIRELAGNAQRQADEGAIR